jgi:hypothetical protein
VHTRKNLPHPSNQSVGRQMFDFWRSEGSADSKNYRTLPTEQIV